MMAEQVLRSTCWECSVKCGSLISVRDGRVVKIGGNSEHPHSEGAFCVKGMNAPIAALEHPDRPLHPLRRTGERGSGQWEQVSWNVVLEEIAKQLEVAEKQANSSRSAMFAAWAAAGVAICLLIVTVFSVFSP